MNRTISSADLARLQRAEITVVVAYVVCALCTGQTNNVT